MGGGQGEGEEGGDEGGGEEERRHTAGNTNIVTEVDMEPDPLQMYFFIISQSILLLILIPQYNTNIELVVYKNT